MHASMRTAKSSPPRPIGGGEGGGATRCSDLGPSPLLRGSMYKEKLVQDLGPKRRTVAAIHKAIHKKVLSPPPHDPPKKGVPWYWAVRGVKIEKFIGQSFCLSK